MKYKRELIAKDALGAVVQEVWKPEGPDEQAEALRLALRAKPNGWTLENELDEIRSVLDLALTGLGWPNSKQRIAIKENNEWREVSSPDELQDGEQFRWSFLWIDKAAEPLSEAYFLGKIAFSLNSIENALKRDDHLNLFHHAVRLGIFQSEIDIRRIALRYATEGQAIAAGRKRAAESVNREHIEMRIARLREMERLVPNIGVNAAAKNLQARGFGGWQGIKKQWNRFKKTRDT